MKTLNLQSVVYQEDTFWVAQCLNVDVSSFGESEEGALENLKEALELYFEDNDQPEISEVTNHCEVFLLYFLYF
jgi:predicted RNase H-like HicB family nuclease